MTDLWTAYLNDDTRLTPFFAHRPGDWASVVDARRRKCPMPLDSTAIEEIARANREWGVAACVVDHAAALASPDARVIVTGQQAGLLGGPLYTLYKAIAAVRWAERIERELRIPTIPIFWAASEDDDFDEVRSFRWEKAQGEWMEYRYQPWQHRQGMPVYDIPIEQGFRDDLAEVFAQVRQTEFTADIAGQIGAIAATSGDMEDFFIRTMAWLLGERAPLFVSPRMNWVRQRAAAVVERELAQPGESSRRVIEAGERLRALGFSIGLHRRPEHVNCFLHDGGVRRKILAQAGQFEIIAPTGERRTVEAAALRSQVLSDPARFGLNVVTRPTIRDLALPTLAYVAGPGEVAYLAQMRGAYEFFGATMPMVLARPQVCLIEPRVERALARLGVEMPEATTTFKEQFEVTLTKAVRKSDTEAQLAAAQQRMEEALEFVGSRMDLREPAVARSFKRLRETVQTGFEKLAARQREAIVARDAEIARSVAALRNLLWPDGLPQERALTVLFPFLNLFGTGLVARLAEAISLDARDVQPIVLSSLMAGKEML